MTLPLEPIVFFGSGPVAAESLRLLAANFAIEAAITKPRPPHHKGTVPVLQLAKQLGIRTLTAANKKELDELITSHPFKARLAVLIDFGIIVSQQVIDSYELGIINSHFSLLPEWRGADPITFSILSGQAQTGISLMLLTAGMDEGPLLAQTPYDIQPGETTPSLTAALIELSDLTLQAILPEYMAGDAVAAPQEAVSLAHTSAPTYSRKLTKDDGNLDFRKPAVQLEREIRGFIDWPKSRTQLGDIDVVITQAHAVPATMPEKPGHTEVLAEEGVLMINTADGYLCIDRLKPAGKKDMSAAEFIRGYGNRLGG